MAIKRSRDQQNLHEDITNMANCLILLSNGLQQQQQRQQQQQQHDQQTSRVFECKTCNRQFPSFQALGGHRASHKKPRLMGDGSDNHVLSASPPKPKTHECSICGLEFAIGQALGGHMRRHRTVTNEQSMSNSSIVSQVVPVVKKSKGKRVLFMDLNLTPLENKFLFGKIVPHVDLKSFF